MRLCCAFTNCRGDDDIDAKRSRPSIGKPENGSREKERVSLFGTDQRITSGPAVKRPHSKAGYMTAPERFADSQIPLAPRAPSIHDPNQEVALPYSITSSARVIRVGGNSRPGIFAVLRLMTRSKFGRLLNR